MVPLRPEDVAPQHRPVGGGTVACPLAGLEVSDEHLDRSSSLAVAPKKLFRIGEVMAHTGLSRQTIHNYTMLGLINAVGRTPAGHRLYGEEVFARLERVKALRETHTLLEIRAILDVPSPPGQKPNGTP